MQTSGGITVAGHDFLNKKINLPEAKEEECLLIPCKCGCTRRYIDFFTVRGKYLCAIGCLSILCKEKPAIAYGSTKEKAKERAAKKWNRRKDDKNV